MKNLAIAVLISSTFAFAQKPPVVTPPAPLPVPAPLVFKSLKEGMQDMSAKLKVISMQSKDAKQNISSKKLSLSLADSVSASKKFLPKSAIDSASQVLYAKMMDETIDLAKQLADAFDQNNNAKATDLLSKMSQQKTDGHTKFK